MHLLSVRILFGSNGWSFRARIRRFLIFWLNCIWTCVSIIFLWFLALFRLLRLVILLRFLLCFGLLWLFGALRLLRFFTFRLFGFLGLFRFLRLLGFSIFFFEFIKFIRLYLGINWRFFREQSRKTFWEGVGGFFLADIVLEIFSNIILLCHTFELWSNGCGQHSSRPSSPFCLYWQFSTFILRPFSIFGLLLHFKVSTFKIHLLHWFVEELILLLLFSFNFCLDLLFVFCVQGYVIIGIVCLRLIILCWWLITLLSFL